MLTTRTKIALARIAQWPIVLARRLMGRGTEAQVRRRGIKWQLDLAEGIDFSIYLLGAFEPNTIRAYSRLVRPGLTVLDIGANVGAHTMHFARLVGPAGMVIAFEPTDWAFAKLRANLALNPDLAARVTPVQAFLVDRDDREAATEVHASWPLDGAGVHAKLRGKAMPAKGARTVTVDGWLREAGVGRVSMVKIDVDGYECDVLAGAAGMLERDGPDIVMELSPYILEERGGSLERLIEMLARAGYGLRDLGSDEALPMDAEALARLVPEGAGRNVIARQHPA